MFKSLTSSALIAATLLSLAALAPTAATASEGARSVGQGMKCSTRAMTNPDGTVTYYQYCYKSI